MRTYLLGLGIAAACLTLAWTVLALATWGLPRGLLREAVGAVPDALRAVRRLRRDPRVPRRAKLAVVLAGLWVLSPVDLIPEFLPVIGPLDDVVVVVLALRYAARQVPREVLAEAWGGDPAVLARLLGAGAVVREPSES